MDLTGKSKKMNLVNAKPEIQRGYKDSLFKALSNYKPLSAAVISKEFHIPLHSVNEKEIVSMPLENGIVKDVYNDVCLKYGNSVIILMEQQSKIDHNIVLRMLIYLSETFKRTYMDTIHQHSRIKILAPKLIIVYNGRTPWKREVKLSDMYEDDVKEIEGLFDFSVKIIDVNRDTLSKEDILYIVFADLIKLIDTYREDSGYNLNAIKNEIVNKYPVMRGFFELYPGKEFFEMVSREDAIKREKVVAYEDGYDYGVAQGIEKGIEQGIEKGIEQTRRDLIRKLVNKFIQGNKSYSLEGILSELDVLELTKPEIELVKSLLESEQPL